MEMAVFSRDESTQLAWVQQYQIPGFVSLAPTKHEIGNAIPIDLDGRLELILSPRYVRPGVEHTFLYQVMSVK